MSQPARRKGSGSRATGGKGPAEADAPAACTRWETIREKLDGKPLLLNAWSMLGHPHAIELAGEAGFDLVTIDQQHGFGGHAEMVACLTAARGAGLPALVRVASHDSGLIGRAIDCGANGVVVPMINTAADARWLVNACKYPPAGARSFGPIRARLDVPGDYFSQGNARTIACAQIETVQALGQVDEILSVDGLDMICVGPNDLAITMQGGRSRDISSADMLTALDTILTACRRHDVIAGIYANDADFAARLIKAGWQVVTVGNDIGWLGAGAAAVVRQFGSA